MIYIAESLCELYSVVNAEYYSTREHASWLTGLRAFLKSAYATWWGIQVRRHSRDTSVKLKIKCKKGCLHHPINQNKTKVPVFVSWITDYLELSSLRSYNINGQQRIWRKDTDLKKENNRWWTCRRGDLLEMVGMDGGGARGLVRYYMCHRTGSNWARVSQGGVGVCGLPGRKGNVRGTQNSGAKKPRGPLRERRGWKHKA